MFYDCFNFNNTNTISFIYGDNIKKNVENDENNFNKNEKSKDNVNEKEENCDNEDNNNI